MNTPSSLDTVLREIEGDSTPYPRMDSAGAAGWETPLSAGTDNLDVQLTPRLPAAPVPASLPTAGPEPSEPSVTDTAHLLSSSLSERQRRLPKIDLRLVSGLVAILLLVVGVGSATVLTQQSQEIRQRAYEGAVVVTPIPEFQPVATVTPIPAAAQPVSVLSGRLPVILGIVAIVGLLVLVSLLFWAFIV